MKKRKTSKSNGTIRDSICDCESHSFCDSPMFNHRPVVKKFYSVAEWEIIVDYSVDSWADDGAQGRLNFDISIDLTSDLEIRYQPWSTWGRHFKVKVPSTQYSSWDDENTSPSLPPEYVFATMSIEEEENAQTVSYSLTNSYYGREVTLCEVIATRNNTLLVQVAATPCRDRTFIYAHIVDFLLVDFSQYGQDLVTHVLSIPFSLSLASVPCLYEGCISPDFSSILLKPNPTYAYTNHITLGNCHGEQTLAAVTKTDEGDWETFLLLNGQTQSALECAFDFDPRYKHSRVAVANMMYCGKPQLQIMDVQDCSVLEQSELVPSKAHLAQNLTFSPDGLLIATLMRLGVNISCVPYFLADVRIFDSDRLLCIHTIRQPDWKPNGYTTLAPAAMFPMFNGSGQLMAVGAGKMLNDSCLTSLHSITVVKVPACLILKNTCRRRIRAWVLRDDVQLLPLPDSIIKYLLFEPSKP